jgi:hypothetical protein
VITREQVADLQPGDVVGYHDYYWPEGHTVTGALYARDEFLCLAGQVIRFPHGEVTAGGRQGGTLTVVSRAPRPLYVNSDRTEPVPGDVVRDADSDDAMVWMFDAAATDKEAPWCPPVGDDYHDRSQMPARLRLLVDGETGQVVP